MQVRLSFGDNRVFDSEIADARLLGAHALGSRESRSPVGESVARALEHPQDFPPLGRAVVPGDRVVLVLDSTVPQLPVVVEQIVSVLLTAQVEPSDITLLRTADAKGTKDPRSALPNPIGEMIQLREHDAANSSELSYLATTAGGERVYLNRQVVDADFVLPVARPGFDTLFGYRPATGVLFPELSDERTIRRLRWRVPTDAVRAGAEAARREIEEVVWLLGLQFAVNVLDGVGNAVLDVAAGSPEALIERMSPLVDAQWGVNLATCAETVVATVEGNSRSATIADLAAALDMAARAVNPGGNVVLLTGVEQPLEPGMQGMVDSEDPDDLLPKLRRDRPRDSVAAYQAAMAVKRAKVYLLSGLDSNLVEDLFMVPLESTAEAQRVIDDAESCLFLGNAHRMRVSVEGERGQGSGVEGQGGMPKHE